MNYLYFGESCKLMEMSVGFIYRIGVNGRRVAYDDHECKQFLEFLNWINKWFMFETTKMFLSR